MHRKIILVVLSILMVSGCAEKQTYDNAIYNDYEKFSTYGNQWLSVSDLKKMHFEETGSPVPKPDYRECKSDSQCYYNKWAESYDSSPARIKKKADAAAKEKSAREAKESLCLRTPSCLRERNVSKYQQQLRQSYRYALSMNPYMQDNYDFAVRNMCEKSAEAQVNGLTEESLLERVKDVAGVSPQSRRLIIDVARACWNLSNLGSDWKKALREEY